ncbi:probable beta-D-xylosidase 5 [Anneissia japonica]|uniref:probable beta-D-xylosidase 5 n=1 Tax=Anneissia japonica TaxID=1529436 RepID=UPI0014256DAA|nr:probable beta-D-xylosidase 5 [Anneissia japonica]
MYKLLFCIVIIFHSFSDFLLEDYPFRNVSLSWNERVSDLLNRLSLEELVLQLARGGSGANGPAPAVPRLGIDVYNWNTECLHGDAFIGKATSFPQAIGLAATFSQNVIHDVASATAKEVRGKFNSWRKQGIYGDHMGLSCFSPVVNILRHPLWGRNQETYGEDPFLTGQLAKAFVSGLHGNHPRYIIVSSGCKHFNAHSGPENIPSSRFTFDAKVSEYDWYTTYLPAFQECVKAGVYSIMCSYNSINGVPSCASMRLLNGILRKEWGFTGYVVSDQKAIEYVSTMHHYTDTPIKTAVACVDAGCNLELQHINVHQKDAKNVYTNITDAVKLSLLAQEQVVELARPLFYTRMRLGEFDPVDMNPYSKLTDEIVETEEHQQLAIGAAVKSFVLLKNEGALPVGSIKNLAVVGPFADSKTAIIGSYPPQTEPSYVKTVLEGLSRIANKTSYAGGCNDPKCKDYNQTAVSNAIRSADFIVVCLGTGVDIETEGNDRSTLALPGQQNTLLQDVVANASGRHIVVLLFNGGPVDINWMVPHPDITAIMECFLPGQATGEAIRRVFGNIDGASPAGRLPYTWPKSLTQVPPMSNYSMVDRTYRYSTYEPLFPFGYGLSYSKFEYNEFQIAPSNIKPCKNITVKVTVQNIGDYASDEVVQLYMEWSNFSKPVPRIQLVGFQRVKLKVKEKCVVLFPVIPNMYSVYRDSWLIEPGYLTLYVGGGQPNQKNNGISNILQGYFIIKGKSVPLSSCLTR